MNWTDIKGRVASWLLKFMASRSDGDKLLHVLAGMIVFLVLAFPLYLLARKVGTPLGMTEAEVSTLGAQLALAACFVVALGKEGYDFVRKGWFDLLDLLATMVCPVIFTQLITGSAQATADALPMAWRFLGALF